VVGNAPFIPEAPIPALLGSLGMAVGGQAGHEIAPDSPMAETAGELLGGLAGGAAGAARSIKTGLRIRDGASNPDFNRALDITVDSESRGNPKAVSPKGAKGLMQVMDATAQKPGHGIKPSNGTPQDTARVGRQLFASLLSKYGHDFEKTWAAYNWGEGRVDTAVKKYGDAWYDHAPKETQDYVAKNMIQLKGGPDVGGRGVPPMDPRHMATAMGDDEMLAALEEPSAKDPYEEAFGDSAHIYRDSVREEDIPRLLEVDKRLNEISSKTNSLEEFDAHPETKALLREYTNLTDPLTRNSNVVSLNKKDPLVELENLLNDVKTGKKEFLTSAEQQDMDASVPKPVVDNTGYEKHTPYIDEPATPANDTVVDNEYKSSTKDLADRAKNL
jgi:hypothetical protein